MTAHTQRAHAKLSPSAAHRWFKCPGSIRMSEGIENKSGKFADEGTAAHELAQLCLGYKQDAAMHLGRWINIDGTTALEKWLDDKPKKGRAFEVTDEMADAVQLYLDTVRGFITAGCEYEIEAKLDLRHIPGMDFGTGDFVSYDPAEKHLVVCDLKYGRGVAVDVSDNEQLMVYALGTAQRFHNRGLDKITMVIVQPRCPHRDGPVRTLTIDAVDLVEFRFQLVDAAARVVDPDAALVPGDHCRFCPAAATCPALEAKVRATAEDEFGDMTVVGGMTSEQIGLVLADAEMIEGWVKRVKQRAHEMATSGEGVKGWKLVASTSHRKFKDDVDGTLLSMLLGRSSDDYLTDPKLKSPAQVEAMVGRSSAKLIADLIYKPRGKIILVPVADPREPVKPDAEMEFAE